MSNAVQSCRVGSNDSDASPKKLTDFDQRSQDLYPMWKWAPGWAIKNVLYRGICTNMEKAPKILPDIPLQPSVSPSWQNQNEYMAFIGDLMGFKLGDAGADLIVQPEIEKHFQKAKYVVLNLETPLTTETNVSFPDSDKLWGWMPTPKFSLHKDAFRDLLERLGVGSEKLCVNLANNHSHDLDLAETRRILDEMKIKYIGTSGNISESFMLNGKTVQVYGATSRLNPRGYNHRHEISQPENLQASKDTTNIVFLHWGWEYYSVPDEQTLELAQHLLQDHNFHAVIGHGPHIMQQISNFDGKPCFFSLGDFITDNPDKRTKQWSSGDPRQLTGIAMLQVGHNDEIQYELVSVYKRQTGRKYYLVSLDGEGTDKQAARERFEYLFPLVGQTQTPQPNALQSLCC